jgi:hypothetical protein
MEKWTTEFDVLRAREDTLQKGEYLMAVAELEIDHTEELATNLFAACCERWGEESETESDGIFQAVWEYGIFPLFRDRGRFVIRQLERRTADGFTSAEVDAAVCRFGELLASLRTRFRLRIIAGDFQLREPRKSEIRANTPTLEKPKLKVKLSKAEERKRSIIFAAIQGGLKAQQYCRYLDSKKLQIPHKWKEESDCPETYVHAYKRPKWAKKIQDEKHRYKQKYDQTSPAARETLIQTSPHSS